MYPQCYVSLNSGLCPVLNMDGMILCVILIAFLFSNLGLVFLISILVIRLENVAPMKLSLELWGLRPQVQSLTVSDHGGEAV